MIKKTIFSTLVICFFLLSLNQNAFSFEISSSFTIGEGESEGEGGAGSNGGGDELLTNVEFALDKEEITVNLTQEEIKQENVTITNTGNTQLNITISQENLSPYISISEERFSLDEGESKTVRIDFIGSGQPNTHTGYITIKTDSMEKNIIIVIEVNAIQPMFEIKVKIPTEYQQVVAGSSLLANITLNNLQKTSLNKINVTYYIKEINGTIIHAEDESIKVETKTSFIKSFKIPSITNTGDYILYAMASYQNITKTDSAIFKISGKEEEVLKQRNDFIMLIFLILITVVVFLFYEKHKKERKQL